MDKTFLGRLAIGIGGDPIFGIERRDIVLKCYFLFDGIQSETIRSYACILTHGCNDLISPVDQGEAGADAHLGVTHCQRARAHCQLALVGSGNRDISARYLSVVPDACGALGMRHNDANRACRHIVAPAFGFAASG